VLVGLSVAGGLAAPAAARAQQPASERAAPADTGAASAADTGAAAGAAPAADTTGGGSSLPVSPLGAFARSLVLPGWGQAAAGKPLRGAFYFAAEAGSLYMVVKSQEKLSAARTALAAGQADQSLVDSRVAQREDWIVLSVFWALLSGVDAWVTANLADFQQPLTPPRRHPRGGDPGPHPGGRTMSAVP